MIQQILKNAYALAMIHIEDDGQSGESARLIVEAVLTHFKGIAREYEAREA